MDPKQRHAHPGVPLFFCGRVWGAGLAACVLMLMMMAVAGCAGTGASRPAAQVMADRGQDPSRRVAALRRVPAGQEDAPVIGAMWRIVWSDREPVALRVACMDRLIARDADTFWAAAATNLVTVRSPAMLDAVCQRITDARRMDMTGPLVRSLARPAKQIADADRPEAAALESLHAPQPLGQVLWGVLFEEDRTTAEQAGAWEFLVRVHGVEDVTAEARRLATGHEGPSLGRDLAVFADRVEPLPTNREQMLWLLYLRQDAPHLLPPPADWPRRSAALRHLAVLAAAEPGQRALSQEDARAAARRRLSGRPFHPRGRDAEDEAYVAPLEERFADHADRLTHADLIHLLAVLDALDRPSVRAALFEQADADHADRESEHGGVLAWSDGQVEAVAYPTALRTNDRAFHSSHRLIEAAYAGLAHYHFHAQEHDNSAYAGPGKGDLAFAERMGMACLVFTFVAKDTLAADYYQPGGGVIDLGVIRRP